MFNIVKKICLGKVCCVSVEGDVRLLRNGLELTDEKGNIFDIETVGMPHYRNNTDFCKCAELVLQGDMENIGGSLFLQSESSSVRE